MNSTAQVLDYAADLLELRGWQTGVGGWGCAFRPEGALCVEGALGAALGLEPHPTWGYTNHMRAINESPAGVALREFLGDALTNARQDYTASGRQAAELDDDEPLLYEWNDRRGRTQIEVVEALRATAIIAGAREVQVVTV